MEFTAGQASCQPPQRMAACLIWLQISGPMPMFDLSNCVAYTIIKAELKWFFIIDNAKNQENWERNLSHRSIFLQHCWWTGQQQLMIISFISSYTSTTTLDSFNSFSVRVMPLCDLWKYSTCKMLKVKSLKFLLTWAESLNWDYTSEHYISKKIIHNSFSFIVLNKICLIIAPLIDIPMFNTNYLIMHKCKCIMLQ